MYHMSWTLDDVRALSYEQLNWVALSLDKQKRKEADAIRRRR